MPNQPPINSQGNSEDKSSGFDILLQDYIDDLLVEPKEQKGLPSSKILENSVVREDEVNAKNIANSQSLNSIKPLEKKITDEKSKANSERKPNLAERPNENRASETHESKVSEKSLSISEKIAARQFREPDPRLKKVSKLLEKITTLPLNQASTLPSNNSLREQKEKIEDKKGIETPQNLEEVENKTFVKQPDLENEELIQVTNDTSFVQRENQSLRHSLDENFQTLIFDVNHLPLAVPLIKLGGIVNIIGQELTPLVGTPDWFLGLVPNERGNLMVVDTQQFLMPERPVEDGRKYDYLIILDNSQWALACHSVGDAKNMQSSDIRWSSKSSKRPWFAGMVVEYMCALIEVDSLINLLADQIVE